MENFYLYIFKEPGPLPVPEHIFRLFLIILRIIRLIPTPICLVHFTHSSPPVQFALESGF